MWRPLPRQLRANKTFPKFKLELKGPLNKGTLNKQTSSMETFAKTAESELSCPVCLELFTAPHIPKDLPGCRHICCEVCLEDLVKRRKKQCPECRKVIQFPRGGVKMLPTNIRIRSLAEKFPKNTDYNSNVSQSISVSRFEIFFITYNIVSECSNAIRP